MPLSFPLTSADISLWLAFSTFILLGATEALLPYIGKAKIDINHKRLERAALVVSLLFLTTIAVTIIRLILVR